MRCIVLIVAGAALGIALTGILSPARATSYMRCRAGKVVYSFGRSASQIHTKVTVYTEGEDPIYSGRGINTEFCEYKRNDEADNIISYLMVVVSENKKVIIPRKCYDGGFIIDKTMRLGWGEKNSFILSFDEYDYETKAIRHRAIAFYSGKVDC